jgi:hypothetical protein
VESFVIVLGAVSDGGFHGLAVLTERSFETKRNQFLYSYIRGGDSVEGRTTDTERAAGGKSQGRGNAKGGNGELHDAILGFGFRSSQRKWADGSNDNNNKTKIPVQKKRESTHVAKMQQHAVRHPSCEWPGHLKR